MDSFFFKAGFQKFMMGCRKLVGMLGCASSVDVHAPGPSTHASGHIITSSSHAGAASSNHAASSSRHVEEPEEDEDDEDVEEAEGSDEDDEEDYDEDDGPPPTQPTQEKRRSHPHKSVWSPSPFQKERPPHRRTTKETHEGRLKRNEEHGSKRGRNK